MGHGTFYTCSSSRKICLEQRSRPLSSHTRTNIRLFDQKDIHFLSGSYFEPHRVSTIYQTWLIDTSCRECVSQHKKIGHCDLIVYFVAISFKKNKHTWFKTNVSCTSVMCFMNTFTLFYKLHSYFKM